MRPAKTNGVDYKTDSKNKHKNCQLLLPGDTLNCVSEDKAILWELLRFIDHPREISILSQVHYSES